MKKLKLIAVNYTMLDQGKYYGGYDYYFTAMTRYFTTEEAAQKFIAEPLYEKGLGFENQPPVMIKQPNSGILTEEILEIYE